MNIFKKNLSLLIVLALTLGALASCVKPAEKQSDTYEAEVRIVFATDDEKMKPAIDALSTSGVIRAKGDELFVNTTAFYSDVSVQSSYVLIGGILYHATSITSGAYTVGEAEKATFGDADRSKVVGAAGAGAAIGIGDFKTIDMNGSDGNYIYNCSDVNDDARDSLCAILSSSFVGMNAAVSLDSVSYCLVVEDGRDASSTLSCGLTVTLDGVNYKITMRTYLDYDYDKDVVISVPTDADSYKEVSCDDIIG